MTTNTNTKEHLQLSPAHDADNNEHATVLIDEAVSRAQRNGTTITTAAARLIAASMHRGPATALCRFAATGRLSQLQATMELWDHPMGGVPDHWWQAFDLYLQQEAPDGAA